MNVVVGVTVLREDCRLLSKFHVECAMCSSSLQMKTEPCTLSCSAPWSVMSLSQLFRRLKQYGLVSLSAQAACVAWWDFDPNIKAIPGAVFYTHNSSTWKSEAGDCYGFEASLDYIVIQSNLDYIEWDPSSKNSSKTGTKLLVGIINKSGFYLWFGLDQHYALRRVLRERKLSSYLFICPRNACALLGNGWGSMLCGILYWRTVYRWQVGSHRMTMWGNLQSRGQIKCRSLGLALQNWVGPTLQRSFVFVCLFVFRKEYTPFLMPFAFETDSWTSVVLILTCSTEGYQPLQFLYYKIAGKRVLPIPS